MFEAYINLLNPTRNLREGEAYDDYKEQFHAIYASFAEDGNWLVYSLCIRSLTWTVDAEGKDYGDFEGPRGSLRDRLTLRLAG